jgi:sugar/nucleoside kinase (ribokinase family)
MMFSPKQQKLYDIVTFSDMCVDLILTGRDVTPEFGQREKLIDDYMVELGGSCNLFACQCAKLGLRTAVVGRVGDDGFGELILQRLEEAGVDTRYVIVDKTLKTGLGVALCPPGDRAILTYLGTINAVYPEDVTDALLASTRHIHHGSFYLHTHLLPVMAEVFRRAQGLGVTTSLDTNWDPQDRWEGDLDQVLPHTDIFMPNDQEALRIYRSLAGQEPRNDEGGLVMAARDFLNRGVRYVAIKAGEQGASIYSRDQVQYGKVQPATGGDSIGAGDSFDAGFLAGWLRGYALEKCLEIGMACGRAVASQIGGLAGQPTWGAVEKIDLR